VHSIILLYLSQNGKPAITWLPGFLIYKGLLIPLFRNSDLKKGGFTPFLNPIHQLFTNFGGWLPLDTA